MRIGGKLFWRRSQRGIFLGPLAALPPKNFPRTRTSEPACRLDSIPYRACVLLVVYDIIVFENLPIDLFSLYILFSQYRSCDNTPENCFFQISFYSRAYVRIIYGKTKDQVPLEPESLGKTKHASQRGPFRPSRHKREADVFKTNLGLVWVILTLLNLVPRVLSYPSLQSERERTWKRTWTRG